MRTTSLTCIATRAAGNHWVQFALEGTKSNRSAVGAQVRLTAGGMTRLQFISGGNSFAGQSSSRVHFGLATWRRSTRSKCDGRRVEREIFSGLASTGFRKLWKGAARRNEESLSSRHTLAASLFGADETFDKAEQALASKDYPSAVSLLEKAVQSDPDSLRNASEYRQAVLKQTVAAHPKEGATADFDKEIAFFEKLVAEHPASSNAFLNYGFAYVDKIPAAGSITQVILANTALTQFTKSIELEAHLDRVYTRGNSYLYWPKIFGRAGLGVADLEKAYDDAEGRAEEKLSCARLHFARGRLLEDRESGEGEGDLERRARAVSGQPAQLKDRLSKQGDDLKTYINDVLDPNKRVDTDLKEIWRQQ